MIYCLNPDCANPINPERNTFCQTCSTPLTRLLRNRFRVIQVLSDEGGFGKTYLAEDADKLNSHCVIKQLAPRVEGTWAQKKALDLFRQEAQRLQELGEHPQIPTLFAYFEEDNYLYLVQQYIEGQDLLDELETRGTFNEQEIRKFLVDLLIVVKFIHRNKIIHRDIKPQNIIRRHHDGRLVLIDFGSAKQLTAGVQSQSGTKIGSHGFSALEQIKDGKAYEASDLFSLGTTCFYLLTGVSPYDIWAEHGYSWVINWRNYLKTPISPELDQIIDKLLKKDVNERYRSAAQVLIDLSQVTPSVAKPPSLPPTTITSSRKLYPGLKAGGIILLLGLGLGGLWYWQSSNPRNIVFSIIGSAQKSGNSNKSLLTRKTSEKNFSIANTLHFGNKPVFSAIISRDGKNIFGSSGNEIKLWDLQNRQETRKLIGHSDRVNAIALSPDGKTLASGSEDMTTRLWNLETFQQKQVLKTDDGSIHAIAFSPDGNTLATSGDANDIKIWDLTTGKEKYTLTGHDAWVRSINFSNDGNKLFSGSFDNSIKIWDLFTGKEISTLKGHSDSIRSIAVSPDGKTLASGGDDLVIKLWNLDTEKQIRALKGHRQSILSIAFSPDGKTLVSGSRDRTIKLWDWEKGKQLHTLTGHLHQVYSVAVSTDGQEIISGSADKTIKIWR